MLPNVQNHITISSHLYTRHNIMKKPSQSHGLSHCHMHGLPYDHWTLNYNRFLVTVTSLLLLNNFSKQTLLMHRQIYITLLNSSLPNSFELWFKWKNLSYNAYTVQMFVCCQLLASLSRLLLWKQLLVKYLWSKLRAKQGKCTYQNNLFVLLQPVFRDYDCQIVIPAVGFETDYIWMPFSTYTTRVKMLGFFFFFITTSLKTRQKPFICFLSL